MLMNFLWLAYRKYEYKYTIIRWTWYIVIRILVASLVIYFPYVFSIPFDYKNIYYDIVNAFYGTLYNLCIIPGNSIYT